VCIFPICAQERKGGRKREGDREREREREKRGKEISIASVAE
jgi:hypothetical protein